MAEVTPLPVVVGCVACGGTAGVEPVAMVPRASGSDRVLTACSACADEVATRALQELESVERHLGVGRG
ncbi:hypothetical protein [Streptomyces tsukubensis]|uniref:hypothetical protein n=1 Tax=Streptomyces tsukubensis TaxID=83656 RepID=UPI00344FCB2C